MFFLKLKSNWLSIVSFWRYVVSYKSLWLADGWVEFYVLLFEVELFDEVLLVVLDEVLLVVLDEELLWLVEFELLVLVVFVELVWVYVF